MKVLAFLQNQWFKEPDRIREIYARHPDKRNHFIAQFLFMGCLSGRRLKTALGQELCDRIIWEEASPEIGGKSGARFQADHDHIKRAIIKHDPDVILVFGEVARPTVETIAAELKREYGFLIPILVGPHPAARKNPMPALLAIARRLQSPGSASRA